MHLDRAGLAEVLARPCCRRRRSTRPPRPAGCRCTSRSGGPPSSGGLGVAVDHARPRCIVVGSAKREGDRRRRCASPGIRQAVSGMPSSMLRPSKVDQVAVDVLVGRGGRPGPWRSPAGRSSSTGRARPLARTRLRSGSVASVGRPRVSSSPGAAARPPRQRSGAGRPRATAQGSQADAGVDGDCGAAGGLGEGGASATVAASDATSSAYSG